MSEKKTTLLPLSDDAVAYAADIIRRGGLVAFPTETVYGLGASAYYPGAAKKIYEAKGRPSDNPLIVHVSEPGEAEDFALVPDEFYRLAERFMPGPLTVVLKKKEKIDPSVTGGLDTVAVRCPDHPAARSLIKASGCPIAAPSANRSGSPSPTTASHVLSDLDGMIDAIIDGGECSVGVESTVISLDGDGGCTILRPGGVTADMLSDVMRSVKVADAVTDPSLAGDRPLSPGMKYKHYSPRAEVIAYDGTTDEMIKAANADRSGRVGAIVPDEYAKDVKGTALLSGDGGEDDACHAFFSLLRRADELSLDRVYVRVPPKSGKFLALYNRLIRAAGGRITKPEN